MNQPRRSSTPSPTRRREPQQERAVLTKERILTAAAEAFATDGYPSVTMLQVAEITGMTKGSVYFHFENKDALAAAVAERFYTRVADIARSVKDLRLPAIDSVARLLIRTAVALRDESAMRAGARLQIERQLVGIPLPLPYEQFTEQVTAWLEEAQAGTGADDAAVRATVLVSAFFGAQHISWILNDRGDLLERTADIVRMLLPSATQSSLLEEPLASAQ